MKKMIVCVLLLVLLAGCIKVQETDSQQETNPAEVGVDETVEDEGVEVPKPKSYVLGAEAKTLVEDQMAKGQDVILPQVFQKLAYGESYVFAIGVNNKQTQEDEFIVNVKFKEAYGNYKNPIDGADEETMNTWIKTVFQPFILGSYKNQIMGIAIESGDMSPGVKAQRGTYVFDVDVYHRISPGAGKINSEYGPGNQISIRVE